jgi:hypothetical protein
MIYIQYSLHSYDKFLHMALYNIKFGFTDDNEPCAAELEKLQLLAFELPDKPIGTISIIVAAIASPNERVSLFI